MLVSYGGGARWSFRNGTTVRVDYGLGQNLSAPKFRSEELIVTLGQAF